MLVLCPDVFPASKDARDIVAFDYAVESRRICVAFGRGDLISVDVDSGTTDCVGVVPSGLEAVAWSADQELVVIVTCDQKFILMRQSFDAICEKDLNPSEFGSGQGDYETVCDPVSDLISSCKRRVGIEGNTISWIGG